MPEHVLVNRNHQTSLSVFDRGVQFGDGIFETMIAQDGRILHWAYHKDRVMKGLNRLQITLSTDAYENIEHWAKQRAHTQPQIIKWVITRGESQRGYAPSLTSTPTEIYQSFDFSGFDVEKWIQGVKVDISPIPITQNRYLAGIKHLNRLDSVLAKQASQGLYEPLLALPCGHIVEASMGNIFWFDGQQFWTPPIDEAGVEGVIRSRLLKEAPQLLPYQFGIKTLHPDELRDAQAAFICNAVIGIWPIAFTPTPSTPEPLITQGLNAIRSVQRLIYTWSQQHDEVLWNALDDHKNEA